MYADNPNIFLSYFTGGWFDSPFSKYLEKRLHDDHRVFLYRLDEDQRTGERWRTVGAEKMLAADGTLFLWTHGVVEKSEPVRSEMEFALKKDLNICLLKEDGVADPDKWVGDKLSVPLRGVDALLSAGYNTFSPLTCVNSRPMGETLNKVSVWAWRAYAKRVARTGK
jgi:hypothetical protein